MSLRPYIIAFILAVCLPASGCDMVRYPGDGGPEPETPRPVDPLPPGAPGPAPPAPGEDPFEIALPPSDTADELPPDQGPAQDGEEAGHGSDPGTAQDVPGSSPDADEAAPAADDLPATIPAEEEQEAGLPPAPVFSFHSPGSLLAGTGSGFPDQIVHAPGIIFPIRSAPAYLQSQVFMPGGGVAGGDQCDPRNYAYPWRDNFCESRSANRGSPFCPVNRIHQGQDIRVGTPGDCNTMRGQSPPERGLHEVVAAEDGVISSVGTYNVKLRSGGNIYNYMHLNMNRLAVVPGQFVSAGDLIGYVSNDFAGTPTTIHLHFEIMQNTADQGWVHVPPYLSLVEAYERRENGPGEQVEAEIGVASFGDWSIPEGYEIIE